MASFALVASAFAFLLAAFPKHAEASRYLVAFTSLLWLGFAGVFIVIALMQRDPAWFMRLPQWILLAPVGMLGLWSAAAPKRFG